MANASTDSLATCAVSVIIPMYNAEEFIAECFDSLLAQTFKNYEVILVDDASTDNSCKIVKSYIKKFSGRLNIFHTEKNSGSASVPRNKGLMLSRGEYVLFVDADDKIAPNALEEMYNYAKEYNVDIVNCTKMYKMNEDCSGIKIVNLNDTDELLVETDMAWRVENLLKNKFGWEIWLRLVRRDFLIENELFFLADVDYGDDRIWQHGLLFRAKKILHLPRAYYFYRQTKNSIRRKKRNSLQMVNSRLRAVINGLRWIDDIMEKTPFFKEEPQLRHKVLDYFTRKFYNEIFKYSLKTSQSEIYESLKQEFGKDFGEHDILIPALCTFVNTNQKKIEKLKEKLEKNK